MVMVKVYGVRIRNILVFTPSYLIYVCALTCVKLTCGGGQTDLRRGIHFDFSLSFCTAQYNLVPRPRTKAKF